MCCSIDMFRLLILRKMKPRPAADGLGPGPRSGRAAGDGGADFVGGGVERSAAETAAKLGEQSILDAARSPPDAGPVSGFPPSRMAPSDDFPCQNGAAKAEESPAPDVRRGAVRLSRRGSR